MSALALVRARGSVAATWGILLALVVVGAASIDGFTTSYSLRSMLVLGAFLGIAAIGQTLCALVGGLDLSIPFVIGAANLGLPYLTSRGVPSGVAVVIILVVAGGIGAVSGAVSRWVSVHSLIVTLGIGFAVQGVLQILTTSGSAFATPPAWLTHLSAADRGTVGIAIPPVVFLWAFLAIVVIGVLSATSTGRRLYAIGDNPLAASRARVVERRLWIGSFAVSAMTAAATGILLLGFTGGGFADVGSPYLFTTIAAVVIGGTSLLGGRGGYGMTVLGVAILTVLTTVLVGFGLSSSQQQAVLGAVIVATVALYAREPHVSHRL
jgi:ribose transport system permease protein